MKATYIKITESEMFVNGLTKPYSLADEVVKNHFESGWIEVLNKDELLKHIGSSVINNDLIFDAKDKSIFEAPPGMHYEVKAQAFNESHVMIYELLTHNHYVKRMALVSFSEAVEEEIKYVCSKDGSRCTNGKCDVCPYDCIEEEKEKEVKYSISEIEERIYAQWELDYKDIYREGRFSAFTVSGFMKEALKSKK